VQVAFYGFILSLLFGALFAKVEGGLFLLILQRVACSLGCLALLWVIARLARMGIFTSDDGVVFRNVFRTEHAPWSAIAVFEPPMPYGTWRKAGLHARLTDGTTISATAVARGLIEGPGSAQDVTDYLNSLLTHHRPHGARANPAHGPHNASAPPTPPER
jgi:Bacterial PH domain